ncbi:serine protease [Streptomyces sp. NPDC002838]|uniref:serine protease n=1 Tax=Streptomyces sp. NPDC002838 TaxID=3154436 RepID=UPI003319FAB4
MAGRGPRTGNASGTARPDHSRNARGRQRPDEAPGQNPGRDVGPGPGQVQGPGRDEALVRIHDPAGRPRGTGFVADHLGTVVTSHETVDGLPRLVLHAAGDRSCVVTADAVTPLPELDLALIHTEGLDVDPLPITVRDRIEVGTYVRVPAGCWREARVLGATGVTYTAKDRFHHLDDALELAIGTAGRDALRQGGGAAGGPVLDAASGAVVAVLGTALRNDHGDAAFAAPLRPPPNGPLSDLLARNATTVPAYGADLNLAGVLELTAASVGRDGPAGVVAGFVGWGSGWGDGGGAGPKDAGGLGSSGAWGSGSSDVRRARSADAGGVGSKDAGGLGSSGDWGSGSLDVRRPGLSGAGEPGRSDVGGLGSSGAWGSGSSDVRRARSADAGGVGSKDAGGLGPSGAWGPGPTHARRTGPSDAGRVEPKDAGGLGSTDPRSSGPADAWGPWAVEPVERAGTVAEFAAFSDGPAAVLGLVGDPGSGRTTELAALAARRARSAEPAPTLWLRGADLKGGDTSVADAAGRALTRAARIVAASRPVEAAACPADLGDATPERLARLARAAGRPLLLLLDGPEEMPPVLAHRLAEWTDGTARWLRETGAKLVVACRGEYWEVAGAGFPEEMLHGGASPSHAGPHPSARPAFEDKAVQADSGGAGAAALRSGTQTSRPFPPCVHLGDLHDDESREARTRYRIPEGTLTGPDARHPLTLRLLAEVHAALPEPPHAPIDREDVFSAYLDLMCLRIAVRLAEQNGPHGTPVRRLAAKVSGQVHEAARRSLGPGQGELDRTSFEAVFPWGTAPARLGGGTGWASAVLTEGLLVPVGTGYRFAHEELADWIQGMHLDLDEALRALVHSHRTRPPGTSGTHPLPVPHHRIGPVIEALLYLARRHGTPRLAHRLEELTHALDADPHSWWAARLLAETLLRVPDATPYTAVLILLTDRIVTWRRRERPVPAEFGPDFWTALPLPQDTRVDLLRRLVLADGPRRDTGPRYLDAAARLLAADPTAVQPHLIRWFDDERPLPATPHATVAKAAQALLHTHRHPALDDLTEVLVDSAHHRADELLAVLAEDEPSAVCRAVDRWAHDERPARRAAAVASGLRTAPHVRTEADRELLRHAALALLARPADRTLHGGALALLIRDPHTRARHLPQALGHFVAGDPQFPPSALVPALATDPDQVLDAFRDRLRRPDAGEALRTLADVTTPALARRVATLVREAVEQRPETAAHVAAYVDRRLEHGPAARAVLLPLVTGLLDGGPERARAALAAVLAAPGTPASRPLRQELLEFLLTHEHEPSVLIAVLHTAAAHSEAWATGARDLVHRAGLLLVRTPQGAARFDRGLVDLCRRVPGFAALVAGWLTETPDDWAAVVGPSARRMIESLAGVRVPA